MKLFLELNKNNEIENVFTKEFEVNSYKKKFDYSKKEIEVTSISYILSRDFSGGLSSDRRQSLIKSTAVAVNFDLYPKGIIRREEGRRTHGGAYDRYTIDSETFRINGELAPYCGILRNKIIEMYDAQ